MVSLVERGRPYLECPLSEDFTAMVCFGVNEVFKTTKQAGNGYRVQL